jgi:hypothetical protein
MFCPKCKSKMGLHPYESLTLSHMAQGMTCCVCGFWMEFGTGAEYFAKSKKSMRKRR